MNLEKQREIRIQRAIGLLTGMKQVMEIADDFNREGAIKVLKEAVYLLEKP